MRRSIFTAGAGKMGCVAKNAVAIFNRIVNLAAVNKVTAGLIIDIAAIIQRKAIQNLR